MKEYSETTAFRGQLAFMPESSEAGAQIRNTPEGRLLWAVLDNGIEQYKKHVHATGRRSKRLFREAEEWIMQDDPTWLCSFMNLCYVLGINPEYIRKGLRQWREAQLASVFKRAA